MDKRKRKIIYALAVIANYLPVLLACFFYGGGVEVYILVFQFIMVYLNFRASKNRGGLAFLCANLLLSTVIANKLSTYMYYTNISSDSETLIVGNLETVIGAVIVVVLSVFAILLKFKKENIDASANDNV